MGYKLGKTNKTEHNGAKNGGGYWGHRIDAKKNSKKIRRINDKLAEMANDPEIQRDMEQINDEFRITELDGLNKI